MSKWVPNNPSRNTEFKNVKVIQIKNETNCRQKKTRFFSKKSPKN